MKRLFIPFLAVAAVAGLGLAGCHKAPPKAAETLQHGAQQIGQGAAAAGKQLANAAQSAGAQARQAVADTAITTRVKAALAANAGLSSLGLHVSTNNGVVTLTGTVPMIARKDLAARVAHHVAGVKRIDNQIVVQPPKKGGQ